MSDDNNKIRLSGTVSSTPVVDHVLYGEEFYTFDLSIPRLSGAVDVIPLTVSNRLMFERLPMLGEQVQVSGQLRSYNKQIDGINRLVITVFAKNFEFGIDDGDFVNEVMLVGFVCKPVIYRRTPFMREIADMLVAVNRAYGKSDYLPCIAWGRNARYAGNMEVGNCVRIEGRIQSRTYQKQLPTGEVQERMTYEVSCSLIDSSKEAIEQNSPEETEMVAQSTSRDDSCEQATDLPTAQNTDVLRVHTHTDMCTFSLQRQSNSWQYSSTSMPNMSGIAPKIDAVTSKDDLDDTSTDNAMPYDEPDMTPLGTAPSEFDNDGDITDSDIDSDMPEQESANKTEGTL